MFVDRPVGIDLGTTNSEIALLEPSEREVLIYADRFGRKTVPSALAWDERAGAWLVGHPARARRGKSPPPVESIKRKMGQRTTVRCGPSELLPEEVSAKILGELVARMREHLAAKAAADVELCVARAVITVPAYFDAPQIEATRRAGELADLGVLGILQEPTAAAIYHTWKNRLGDGNFLVYDLGGGTFDVSILRCVGGEYQVLAIDGDNYLGGDDFDRRWAERLRKQLATRGYALALDVQGNDEDRARFGRLVHLAQEIKESLSTSEVVHVSKSDFLEDRQGEPVSFEADIGRAEYEEGIADLCATTLTCCERALAHSKQTAGVGIEEIDHVVLVGGSTRVPLVQRSVVERLCARSRAAAPLQDEVDTCVALGAAIHAAQIGGLRIGDRVTKTVVSFTTPLVAQAPTIRVGLAVEEAPEGAARISIAAADGTVLARADLGEGAGPFRFDVPLGNDRETALELVVASRSDERLGALPFALYRGDVRPRASALSRPSVIAKDIGLEVVKAGRRDRRVLLARGTGLPATTQHQLFTADQSGAVVLRLLQGRMPIKTLVLAVPTDLPVGSPVDVTIGCDETMRMEAKADVAGRKLWATLEAPQEPRFDPRGDVEVLLAEAEAVGRSLWGGHAEAFRREADALVAAIREVVATDPDKLSALAARLRLIVDEFRGDPADGMSPPMHRFEYELDQLRRLVYRTTGTLVGMDRDAWEARVSEIETRAHTAYAAGDASGWRRAYNEVQALYETAVQEEFAAMRLDDPAYLVRRLTGVTRYANRIERDLADFVPSAADEVRALQVAERDRLMSILGEKVTGPLSKLEVSEQTDAADLRRKLEAIGAELERIEGALERIPSLGLLTERGGAPPAAGG